MYARWFLFTLGKAETKAYVVNGLCMLASFFIFRNVIGVGAPLHWHLPGCRAETKAAVTLGVMQRIWA